MAVTDDPLVQMTRVGMAVRWPIRQDGDLYGAGEVCTYPQALRASKPATLGLGPCIQAVSKCVAHVSSGGPPFKA